MAAFEYHALDSGGHSHKGILTGDSLRHIRSQLRDQGLSPVDVRPVEETERKAYRGSLFKRNIPVASLALMTRQLATLVRAGMPLEESLRVLGEQVRLPRLKSVVAGLRSQIMEGSSLSAALSQYNRIFPQYYCAMVEAGEASGQLDDILERLAEYTEQQNYLRQKVAVAMIYPVILTGVAITVVIALLTYVVPEVVRVFNQTGQDLPLLTQWLIITSDFVRQQGLLICGLVIGAFFLGSWLLRKEHVRYRYERLKLSLPFIGDLTRTIISARLARILSILTERGVTLVDALGISLQIIKSLPVREAMSNAAESLREGGRLHLAMNNSGYFPPMLVHMISVGEESGELEKMLDKAANHHEHEMNTMITAATSLLEPVLIIIMGGIVLLIVLAILLPIFEMNQLVGL